jgi:hypothetical protein
MDEEGRIKDFQLILRQPRTAHGGTERRRVGKPKVADL